MSYKKGDVTSEGIRVLRGGNIQDTNVLLLDDDVYLPKSYYDPIKEIRKGDILIVASTGSKKVIGKPGFVNENYENISIGAFLRICRPIINYLSEYIQLIFASEYYRNHIRTLSQGTNINNVKKEYLENLFVPLPPLKEQEMILTKINHLLPLIDDYGVNQEELEALNNKFPNKIKDSILQYAIQGKLVPQDSNDDPASVLLERIKKEKEQLIKDKKIKRNKNESVIFKENNHFYEKIGNKEPICIDDKIPWNIPNNWEWCRLNSLGEIVGGGTPKTKINEYWENGTIPWLTPADMKFVDGKYVSRGNRNITKLGLEESSAKLMPKNSIIFSSRAPIGYIAISKNELCTNQGFKSLVPFYEGVIDYVYYCLIALTTEIQSRASGTTFKEISGKRFGETLIPFPPLEEQKRIVKKIQKIIKIFNL